MSADEKDQHVHQHHKHLKNKKKLKMFEFTLKTFYKCEVCDKVLLFYKKNIREHVRNKHKMQFTEYESQYKMFSLSAQDIEKEGRWWNETRNRHDIKENSEIKIEIKSEKIFTGQKILEEVREPKNEEKKLEKNGKEIEIKLEKIEDQDDIVKDETMQVEENLNNDGKNTFKEEEKDQDDDDEEGVERKYSDDPAMMCRVQCNICSKELPRDQISNHMARVHYEESFLLE